MPFFPGCETGTLKERQQCSNQQLAKFIMEHLKYPKEAETKNIQGKVHVQFTIGTDGKIKSPTILKKLEGGCSEEVLRIVNLMNEKDIAWTPARKDGKVVAIEYTLPIVFKL